jgi:hypothetical protein
MIALLMVYCVVLLVQVRAADVELPDGATFVVANSLTVSKKAETADRRCGLADTVIKMLLLSLHQCLAASTLFSSHMWGHHVVVLGYWWRCLACGLTSHAGCACCRYNLRVVECRLAAMVLAVALGKPLSEAVSITTLKDVEPLIIDKYGPGAEAQDKAVKEHLHEGMYMPEEVRQKSPRQGLPQSKFLATCHCYCRAAVANMSAHAYCLSVS